MRNPLHRRDWLLAAAGVTAQSLLRGAQSQSKAETSKLGLPGLFPARVVEVHHPGCIAAGDYQAEPVQQMLDRGMRELTGAPAALDAWRLFVEKGDVVGIKVNPVGRPHVISSPLVLRPIVAALNAAGIPNKDIVVYDRYRAEFLEGGFDKWLPDGVRWTSATQRYDNTQQAIEGYDADHYMDMALVNPGQDVSNLTARRSYVALYATRQVNKLINLCVLKDHQSAGITIALKTLSHGFVNNVARSHSTPMLNACGAFIPAVVALPAIRNKAVLHICDAVKAQFHGGPSGRPQFVWEHQRMYFATDAVALDRIGWTALDERRKQAGRAPLAEALPDPPITNYARRQVEHVDIAGALGLGEWRTDKIAHRRVSL